MCISAKRTCPGCGTVTDFSELDTCDKGQYCPKTTTYELPMRREHFARWDCPTPECTFNNDHQRRVEREYVLARLAQRGGDLEALAPLLTADVSVTNRSDTDNIQAAGNNANTNAIDNGRQAVAGNAQPRQRRPRIRVLDKVELNTLPNHVQQQIQSLRNAIDARRPLGPKFARRGAPPRKSERWGAEEDQLLLLLRDNEFGYNQIENFFPWRHRNPLEKRVGKLQTDRANRQQGGG
ncbi:hypothetical protein C8A00DRAFT_19084 [Chaetomidium leptoderma]|uniref:Uncharacterized protein n=1 Tax=Chaetomidium leptoderma TaxID=669021 RepID=A0AAN6VD09_9PEZI|nr:hypothetical protein C8A00DRAFT_19084 [Chaetomidium leptoderma]